MVINLKWPEPYKQQRDLDKFIDADLRYWKEQKNDERHDEEQADD